METAKNKIKKYLLIVILISGTFFSLTILLIKLKLAVYPDLLTVLIGTIGTLAPTIACVILSNKKISIKNFMKLTFEHKKGTFKYVAIFYILYIIIFLLTKQYDKDFSVFFIVPLFIHAIALGGGFEEYGWRGVLQTNLEKLTSFPVAAILTGIIWALWHLPIWVIQGLEISFTFVELLSFLSFVLGCIEMSFMLGYIYKMTNSIFYCSLFHGLHNTLSVIFDSYQTIGWSITYEFINLSLVALALFLYYKYDLKKK